jgi:hypothetical protein
MENGYEKVKNMYVDITDILRQWEYDPEDMIRIQKLKDGREVLHVRQPFGIEQYELSGRPDGKRPFNKESVLAEFLDRIERFKRTHGTAEEFKLKHDDFLLLQSEGILYYSRYLILYQIGDFDRTVQDTMHNLLICDLVEKHLDIEEDRNELLQYKPYILRVNAIAKAMIQVNKKLKNAARQIIKSAIDTIQNIPRIDTPTFQLEKVRSIESLRTALMEISTEQNVSSIERLQIELDRAVEEENYEKAAEIRDTILKFFQKK